jgi:hypothetical protein
MIIMKKTCTNKDYSSPSIELLVMACEQAVMAGSTQTFSGVDNEEFTDGGKFNDWV